MALFVAGTSARAATFNPYKPSAKASVSSSSSASAIGMPVTKADAATDTGNNGVTVSVSDSPTVIENPGAMAVFTVSLNKASSKTVKVTYTTVSGTATSGQDFVFTTGTLTFSPGQTSKTVNVTVLNNPPADEPSEFFYLSLSNTVNANVARSLGKATIVEPTRSSKVKIDINDAPRVNEDPGGQVAKFTVKLNTASPTVVKVNYKTANGTANSTYDYVATQGTLTFQPGQTSKIISVSIRDPKTDGDGDAPIEYFYVNLSNPTPNAVIVDSQGRGEIAENK